MTGAVARAVVTANASRVSGQDVVARIGWGGVWPFAVRFLVD